MEAYVKKNNSQGITTVEFFHPQSNSLPASILNELAATISRAGLEEQTKLIILKSGGNRTFCSGASFEELAAIQNEAAGLAFFSGFAKVINAMRTCEKLIIGRVQGKAVGGGVGLAGSCDYCFATKYAEIRLSELAVGIGPFVVGPAVERKIGTSAAYELAIDATHFRTAEWALQKGLYAGVYNSIEEMDTAIMELAMILANSNPEAMAAIKKAFWAGTDHWDTLLTQRAAISGKLVLSAFTRTAIANFNLR